MGGHRLVRISKNPRACSGLNLLTDHKVSTLEFVCLTHPHDDHYKGMSHLLREFQVNAFWSFGGFQPPDFRLLRTFFKGDAQSSGLKDARENARELETIFDLIQTKRIPHQSVGPKTLIYPSIDDNQDFQIWGLAPSGRHTDEYRTCLLNSFGRDRTFKSALPPSDHNLISSAMLVIFEKSRLILGGDVEEDGWRDVLNDKPVISLSAHAVKVSHHGSYNGYCKDLWANYASEGRPTAFLTPYVAKGPPRKTSN